MQAHRLRVGERQHQPGADRALGADRAEQIRPGVASIARRPWAGAATRPDPGPTPDRLRRAGDPGVSVPCWPTRLNAPRSTVLEPDLDRQALRVLGQRL